jgi:phenylpropionate dioxygenase-like ring-hydroxylating dioxygenase large terminal subunit
VVDARAPVAPGARAVPARPQSMNRALPPYPNGWFRVAASRDVVRGAARPLRYFGQDLVAFRGEDGIARVLDAHCPHLGAHLAHGGRVEGGALRCPFHAWLWDGDGRCLDVPYASRVPPRARVRSWPVREVNGLIFAYYHARQEPPDWEIPELPEYSAPDWIRCRQAHQWTIRTHAQDLAENGIDTGHMPLLHRAQTRAIVSDALDAHGPVLVHRMAHTYNLFALSRLYREDVSGPLEITYYGLGCAVNRAQVRLGIELHYLFMFLFTPIDAEHVEVTGVFSMKKVANRLVTWLLTRKAMREGGRTIEEDIPIWEHKVYRSAPLLCDGDGPIMRYRQWTRQFYSEPA